MDRDRNIPMALAVFVCCVGLTACTQTADPNSSGAAPPASAAATGGPDQGDSTALPASARSGCPASDFKAFLQAFAADPAIRSHYTADTVAVTEWKNVDETELGTQVVAVPRTSYDGFSLAFRNGAFHHVAADGSVDPAVENPAITKTGSGFDVGYVYGMSEGNSWHFSAQGGCWTLTSDPDPPSP